MIRKCYFVSNKGNRINNEDKFQINNFSSVGKDEMGKKIILNNALITVSDGMGGEEYGELASLIVTKELARLYNKKLNTKKMLENIINTNNLVVSKMNEKKCRIGATLVSAIIKKNTIDIYNVGDSRAYLYSNKLIQLTKDHATNNGLTQHMGMNVEDGVIEPFVIENISIKKNDYLLLCSDGLYNMVNNEEIEKILNSKQKEMNKCQNFLDCALKNGGKDNITFLLIKF